MTKSYEYLEVNPVRGILFTLMYIAAIVALAIGYFGGLTELADTVNNFGSAKGLGLLTGLICIGPIFFLIRFVYSKVYIHTDTGGLTISRSKQEDKRIRFTEIGTIAINAERINTLTLYDHNGIVLFKLLPFNNHHILPQLAGEISKEADFEQTKENRKLLNTTYQVTTYTRKK